MVFKSSLKQNLINLIKTECINNLPFMKNLKTIKPFTHIFCEGFSFSLNFLIFQYTAIYDIMKKDNCVDFWCYVKRRGSLCTII